MTIVFNLLLFLLCCMADLHPYFINKIEYFIVFSVRRRSRRRKMRRPSSPVLYGRVRQLHRSVHRRVRLHVSTLCCCQQHAFSAAGRLSKQLLRVRRLSSQRKRDRRQRQRIFVLELIQSAVLRHRQVLQRSAAVRRVQLQPDVHAGVQRGRCQFYRPISARLYGLLCISERHQRASDERGGVERVFITHLSHVQTGS